MRVKKSNADISVQAISGTEVVLFGLNIPKEKKTGLMGFKIEKSVNGKWVQLTDGRKFKDSEVTLIQRFMWSDYSVDKMTQYSYKFTPCYGTVDALTFGKTLKLKITTENPDADDIGIFFNRGVAGSQAYSRRFSKYQKYYKEDPEEQDPAKIDFKRFLKPEDVPKRAAYKWLSRGLEEAVLAFIKKAKGKRYGLRASLYELSHKGCAEAFVDALERGVDVKILHHAKTVPAREVKSDTMADITVTHYKTKDRKEVDYVSEPIEKKYVTEEFRVPDPISVTAMKTLGSRGISDAAYLDAFKTIFLPRTKPSISHNKFIILLKDGKPIEVWSGSTNLTDGGIYGQSNVGQIVRNKKIASQYYEYWKVISEDPSNTTVKNWLLENNPNLKAKDPESDTPTDQSDFPKNFIGAIFSPRKDLGMMDWYAEKVKEAKNSVFLTSAFSIDERFAKVFNVDSEFAGKNPFLRYLIVESPNAPYIKKYLPEIEKCNQNRVAWGDTLKDRPGVKHNEELVESLTGLNDHVNYLHTKYMVVDALTDDPIVISGSANFSKASTQSNDENMLILRGNTRVADIFVTEFLRLFNHFKIRNESNALSDAEFEKNEVLDPKGKWVKNFFKKGTQECQERVLFSVEGK